MYATREVLPFTGDLAPGERRALTVRPLASFRPDRLMISAASFPVPRARRAATWLPVKLGAILLVAANVLVDILRVSMIPRTRLEPITEAELADFAGELGYDDDGNPCRVVLEPQTLRERVVRPAVRAARWLRDMRWRWQERQLGTLVVRNITIGKRSQFSQESKFPGDYFTATALNASLALETCPLGDAITLDLENTGRRPCRLLASLTGVTPEYMTPEQRVALNIPPLTPGPLTDEQREVLVKAWQELVHGKRDKA